MQLGRTADHAVDDIGDNHGAVLGAAGGVTLNEAVVEKAVETVVPACGIKPQEVIAQKRQFFLLAQGPHIARNGRRAGRVFKYHVKTPLGVPRGGVRIPRPPILCDAACFSRREPAQVSGIESDQFVNKIKPP
jgi:hypothetical protein